MPTVTLPIKLIEHAKSVTGLTTKDAAVRALIERSRAGGILPDKAQHPDKPVPLSAIKALNRKHGPAFRAGTTVSTLPGAEHLDIDALI